MSVAISAVVCTYDRAAYLRKALASLSAQTMPDHDYEILVIDNGSSDDTRQMVTAEYAHLTNLVYARATTPGLAHARNAGFRQARGRYVAYLDDDALAAPSWLARIVRAFETVRPMPGCVGGKVEPIWEAPRPGWLADPMLSYLSVIDWSAAPGVLGPDRFLAGTNMAFPRGLLEETGGFRPELARRGTGLLSNDELWVENMLRRRGHACYYDPEIVVAHHVPAARLARGYLARRYFWQGVSDATLHTLQAPRSRLSRFAGACRHAQSRVGVRGLLRLLSPTTHPDRFHRQCETRRELGYVVGLLRVDRR